jgi:hypothetical protein
MIKLALMIKPASAEIRLAVRVSAPSDDKNLARHEFRHYPAKSLLLKAFSEIGEYEVAAEYEVEGPFRQLAADVLLQGFDVFPEDLPDRIAIIAGDKGFCNCPGRYLRLLPG